MQDEMTSNIDYDILINIKNAQISLNQANILFQNEKYSKDQINIIKDQLQLLQKTFNDTINVLYFTHNDIKNE